jgi:acyl-CoA reductase-like NAD-dependent aldehyde dehydrogenase
MHSLAVNGYLPNREKLSRSMVLLHLSNIYNHVEPSSAEVLGNVADMSRDDFIRAIKIADRGFRKYSTLTTFAERGAQLRKWFDLIQQNLDDCTSSKRLIILTESG